MQKIKVNVGCEFGNSDVPFTICSFIELYRGIAEIDVDSVEKFRISKPHETNANPEKNMPLKIPKKKPLWIKR